MNAQTGPLPRQKDIAHLRRQNSQGECVLKPFHRHKRSGRFPSVISIQLTGSRGALRDANIAYPLHARLALTHALCAYARDSRACCVPCRLFIRGIRTPQVHAGPATALRFRLGLALPPRPCASASALRFRLGLALPPRPCASASALRAAARARLRAAIARQQLAPPLTSLFSAASRSMLPLSSLSFT